MSRHAASLPVALLLGLWVAGFGLATVVSAVGLADARYQPPALRDPDAPRRFHPPRPAPVPDSRLYFALLYSTFASAVLLVLGLIAMTKFVLPRK
jgi:hypothetical protein